MVKWLVILLPVVAYAKQPTAQESCNAGAVIYKSAYSLYEVGYTLPEVVSQYDSWYEGNPDGLPIINYLLNRSYIEFIKKTSVEDGAKALFDECIDTNQKKSEKQIDLTNPFKPIFLS